MFLTSNIETHLFIKYLTKYIVCKCVWCEFLTLHPHYVENNTVQIEIEESTKDKYKSYEVYSTV